MNFKDFKRMVYGGTMLEPIDFGEDGDSEYFIESVGSFIKFGGSLDSESDLKTLRGPFFPLRVLRLAKLEYGNEKPDVALTMADQHRVPFTLAFHVVKNFGEDLQDTAKLSPGTPITNEYWAELLEEANKEVYEGAATTAGWDSEDE